MQVKRKKLGIRNREQEKIERTVEECFSDKLAIFTFTKQFS
jgi:hypothetical protein